MPEKNFGKFRRFLDHLISVLQLWAITAETFVAFLRMVKNFYRFYKWYQISQRNLLQYTPFLEGVVEIQPRSDYEQDQGLKCKLFLKTNEFHWKDTVQCGHIATCRNGKKLRKRFFFEKSVLFTWNTYKIDENVNSENVNLFRNESSDYNFNFTLFLNKIMSFFIHFPKTARCTARSNLTFSILI